MSVQILIGDCRERMKELPGASVDSVVCDPPYHLTSIVKRFGAENAAPAKVGKTGAYARVSKGFMGQTWDGGDVAFDSATWAEVLRVLKPGGHMVAFSGTRTYHRMVCAIEDAGFEIRDQLAWVYGSGFPKSLDVSKAIDKQRDDSADGAAVGAWLKSQREARGFKQKEVAALWPSVTGGLTGCVANWETLGKVPKWDQWLQLKEFIGFGDEMDAEVWRLNGRKGLPSDYYQEAEIVGEHEASAPGLVGMRFDGDRAIRARSEAAQQWQGWGTALKPSFEPICLARRPLIGSVAANVLAHGTGALNIDGCRIETDWETDPTKRGWQGRGTDFRGWQHEATDGGKPSPNAQGRWPANLCHDGSNEVLAGFPDELRARGNIGQSKGGGGMYGHGGCTNDFGAGDSGSAARFFYTAKATTAERGEGNNHPTVKPVALMRWLCRLVTPKGGTILDPFMGSGSTGIAADAEQFNFIGCELSAEYAEIARKRIADQAGMFADIEMVHSVDARAA